jgi:hypothetical protein
MADNDNRDHFDPSDANVCDYFAMLGLGAYFSRPLGTPHNFVYLEKTQNRGCILGSLGISAVFLLRLWI